MHIGEIGNEHINFDYRAFTTQGTQFTEAILKAQENEEVKPDFIKLFNKKYPQVSYHVGDASKLPHWDRNDFPVSRLFGEDVNAEELENWQPPINSPNPKGSERYIQNDVRNIPDSSRSIMIHPDVQSKIDKDSEYDEEIYRKIDRYFQKDIEINERILPGCTQGITQFVSIDKDGNIDKTCSITNCVDRNAGDYGFPPRTIKRSEQSLLEDIKNTYGEKYFDPKMYVADMTGSREIEYGLQLGIFGEGHKRRPVNIL